MGEAADTYISFVMTTAEVGMTFGASTLLRKGATSVALRYADDVALRYADDAALQTAKTMTNLTMRSDIVLSSGRSGQLVKNLTGPANSVLKGSGKRAFITNDAGQVIWDITKDRAKSVIPGQGFGPKVTPTKQQLDLLNKIWGN